MSCPTSAKVNKPWVTRENYVHKLLNALNGSLLNLLSRGQLSVVNLVRLTAAEVSGEDDSAGDTPTHRI